MIPFSIVSEALSVAQACVRLTQYMSSVKHVDEEIEGMVRPITELSNLLTTFHGAASRIELSPSNREFWKAVERSLSNCGEAIERFNKKIQNGKVREGLLRMFRQRVSLDWGKMQGIATIKQDVAACREVVTLSLEMITLYPKIRKTLTNFCSSTAQNTDTQVELLHAKVDSFMEWFRGYVAEERANGGRTQNALNQLQNCGLLAQTIVLNSQAGSASGTVPSDARSEMPDDSETTGFDEDQSSPRNDFSSRILHHQLRTARNAMEAEHFQSVDEILTAALVELQTNFPSALDWKEETLEILSQACCRLQKWEKAKSLLEELVELRKGPEKRTLCVENLESLARVLLACGDIQNAEKSAHEAVIGKHDVFGHSHPSYYRALELLVKVYEAKGDEGKANGYRQELPDDYDNPERIALEKLRSMGRKSASRTVGSTLLTSLLPDEDHDWRWQEIKKNVANRERGLCGSGSGYTLLHALAEYGTSISAIHILLEEYPEVAAKDDNGYTALHSAAKRYASDKVDVVRLLLDHGAAVDAKDNDGVTPLMLAGNVPIATALLQNGASVHEADKYGRTALYHAASNEAERDDIVQILISWKSNVNSVTDSGWTALHSAASRGYEDIVHLLIENGAKQLQTAQAVARRHGHRNLAENMSKKGKLERKWSEGSQKTM
jgi:tetratricopeptide (TPR) repeat protein